MVGRGGALDGGGAVGRSGVLGGGGTVGGGGAVLLQEYQITSRAEHFQVYYMLL